MSSSQFPWWITAPRFPHKPRRPVTLLRSERPSATFPSWDLVFLAVDSTSFLNWWPVFLSWLSFLLGILGASLLCLLGLFPELFYEKFCGLTFQYFHCLCFGLRRSEVKFERSEYNTFVKELHGTLWKEQGGQSQKRWASSVLVFVPTNCAMLGRLFLFAKWCPSLLPSRGLSRGWGGQWNPDDRQELSLLLSYLIFHNFSAHSRRVRR